MLRGIRIAIADGHAGFRKSLGLLLERHNSSIVGEADTGLSAVELVDEHRPDVLVMDALLPMMDGVEATRVISTKYPMTKVIVYTRSLDERIRARAIEAGAWHVVRKEIYIRGLVNIIRKCRQKSHLQNPKSNKPLSSKSLPDSICPPQ